MERLTIRRDLGVQLLILYLFLVGPMIIALIFIYQFGNKRLEEDVKSADLALAKTIAQETEITMRDSLVAIQELGQNPIVINADISGMENLFANTLAVRPDIDMVYRLNGNGIMLYHYPEGPISTEGSDFSFRNYFQRARLTTRPLISKGRISKTTNEAVAAVIMPIWNYRNGDFLGIVGTDIKLEYLSQLLRQIVSEFHPQAEFLVTIIDSSGKIIAHPKHELLLDPLQEVNESAIENVLLGKSGSIISENKDGVKYLYSYVPIYSAGWGVIIGRSTEEAFATPNTFNRVMIGATSLFIIIGLFFWLSLSRQFIRPLEQLSQISQKIGISDIEDKKETETLDKLSGRTDQIGHVIRNFQRMEEAIESRLNELSILLETSAAVISTLDIQTVLERILEQVEHLFDVNKSAIVALDENTGLFKAKATRGISDLYTEQIAIDPTEPQSPTMRAIRSGFAIQISDTETDPTFAAIRPRARAEGYRSLIAVPLKTQHAPPAALLIFRTHPHVFSTSEINLLTNFANHAAMAFENATLYARSDMKLQEQTHWLEALIHSLHDGLILEDLSSNVIYANRMICDIAGLEFDGTKEISIETFTKSIIANATNQEQAQKSVEMIMNDPFAEPAEFEIKKNKKTIYIRLEVCNVKDSKGIPIGKVQIYHDVTLDREIDLMKSSLISTVSHELRTPLASIKGYASTLLADDVKWDEKSQNEFIKIISCETDRLSSLVSDLLDLSKIEGGNFTLQRTQSSLDKLVQRAVETCYPNPSKRLHVYIPDDFPLLFVDKRKMEAVLRNLIENAIKYSWKESPINISGEIKDRKVIIRVEDQGPGIPKVHQQDVFRSFYRLENRYTSKIPGSGLGLAICEGFIRAHGGKIWVEPRETGTCIAFSIPLMETN